MKTYFAKNWKIILAMVGVFLAGGIVGGVVTTKVIVNKVRYALIPANWEELAMAGLTRELDLTAEQQKQVQPIVADGVEESRIIFREAFQQWAANMAHARSGLEPILTPEQRTKLEELSIARREKFQRLLAEE